MFGAPFSRADSLAIQARTALTLLLDLRTSTGVNPPIPIQQSRQDLLEFRVLESNRGHLLSVAFIDYQLSLADQGKVTLGATRQQICEYTQAVGLALARVH